MFVYVLPIKLTTIIAVYIYNILYFNHFFLIPLQAWTGPEGSRRLRLTDFKTIGT
jgi:hypothetical protein